MVDEGANVTRANEGVVVGELLRRERAGEQTAVELGPWSAYMLIAGLQASARLLPVRDLRLGALREVAAHVEPLLGEGTAAAAMVEAGWRHLDQRPR